MNDKDTTPGYTTEEDLLFEDFVHGRHKTVRYPSILHFTYPDDEVKSDLSLESIIWQQSGRNNYLILYKRTASDCRKGTMWILSSGNQVLWSAPMQPTGICGVEQSLIINIQAVNCTRTLGQ